jgi:hypothetical protein
MSNLYQLDDLGQHSASVLAQNVANGTRHGCSLALAQLTGTAVVTPSEQGHPQNGPPPPPQIATCRTRRAKRRLPDEAIVPVRTSWYWSSRAKDSRHTRECWAHAACPLPVGVARILITRVFYALGSCIRMSRGWSKREQISSHKKMKQPVTITRPNNRRMKSTGIGTMDQNCWTPALCDQNQPILKHCRPSAATKGGSSRQTHQRGHDHHGQRKVIPNRLPEGMAEAKGNGHIHVDEIT